MKSDQVLREFYEPEDDVLSKRNLDDTRRPKLTLKKINKLRKSKDVKAVDKKEYMDFVPMMYGTKSDGEM